MLSHLHTLSFSFSLSLAIFLSNRMLTFCYLAAFNWWLVLCPSTLSHDWQMGSIPLLTSISDPRNLLTLWAFASTILMLHRSILDFEVCIVSSIMLCIWVENIYTIKCLSIKKCEWCLCTTTSRLIYCCDLLPILPHSFPFTLRPSYALLFFDVILLVLFFTLSTLVLSFL